MTLPTELPRPFPLRGVEACGATPAEARARVDRIKTGVEVIWQLIVESYQARDWQALGYASWDELCTREFGAAHLRLPREERAETVQSLRDAGLSLRAISAATGHSVNTIRGDLYQVDTPDLDGDPSGLAARVRDAVEAEQIYDPSGMDEFTVNRETGEVVEDEDEPLTQAECEALDAALADAEPAPKITGIDGKQYAQTKPPSPRAPQRKPLTDEFRGVALDLDRIVGHVGRLASDDRFKKNADQISQSYLHYLVRAHDALADVISQLSTGV